MRAERDLSERAFRAGVAACAAAVGAFLLLRLTAWPPHEDETLALYVGHGTLGELADTVLGKRGGAPLHYIAAWVVAHLGGGLTGLRAVSATFAVASVPLIAVLVRQLTDRATALTATVLASASWVLLFHGVYGRMYSLFLFTGTLSYVALLAALRRGGIRRWGLWAAAVLLCIATHPYGALVLCTQGLFVLLTRERVREALLAFAAVLVLGIPFWLTDLVLADRFDVGLGGGGGDRLGSPLDVLTYLWEVGADFSAGPWVLPVVLALAGVGAWLLAGENRRAVLLVGAVVAVPVVALLAARLGRGAAPESRHLIFALPFFAMLVATALVAGVRRGRAVGRIAVAATALLVAGQVAWAWQRTPPLFTGDPAERTAGRAAASAWLASTGRPDDVLLGYEPIYLGAWERSATFSRLVLPRADARLAAQELESVKRPLGRGVWLFDAYDTSNIDRRLTIRWRLPRQAKAFEARVFGPYLVIRTRRPTGTALEYLRQAAAAQIVGRTLAIGDADINFDTVSRAAALLGYEPSEPASRSISSR